ncbi:MAG: DUF2202 domain-containing protein [Candidatus Izemoplasmatales bacterium]
MKKGLIKGLIVTGIAIVGVATLSLTSVNAESVYTTLSDETEVITTETTYTLEEMLTYAIQDEYLAQAEYNAIIDTYGAVKPFTNIVLAEQTHINLLLPLFETYGIEVPVNDAYLNVVIPDSLTSALATGVDAETANIAMYETFLAQADLPEDVATVFTYLVSASQSHLDSFLKDRYSCVATDVMNQIKNQFKKAFGGENGSGTGEGSGNQYKGSNGQGGQGSKGTGSGYAYKGTNGNDGVCTDPVL